ncbi:MAG: L-aspartate oxidase [Verrucomicrobia bacterium RIFCSPHIGHO2_12_FULL_41_10]|nr:MAG: L-aspartate oxidase [Verrucomicrobia bacterium RIFCSPHIGHO2_12_FULL_41_10]HLB34440.1 L-aspartate oxidase [Chthoniobacterales bacterium]
MLTFDYVIVGSGIAGLTFALKAAEKGSVAIVTKRSKSDSNTAWAQGGIACVTSTEDSIGLHMRDTLIAGDGLCHEEVVKTILTEGPERVAELVTFGMHFDERISEQGICEFDLGKEGGHSKRRILHARDATGFEIEKTLLEAVARHPEITLLENHMAVDLLTTKKLGVDSQNNRCIGLYVLDEEHNTVEALRTDVTILATGGCGKVYLYTTNPDIATGDGVAIAWRAGAQIANMEFMQFHPTCLFHPKAKSFLITEAVRGEGGLLLNSAQERFMKRYDSRLELAPRDIVARAIDAEMKKRGDQCVYLDISHKPAAFLRERFPTIYETCLQYGIDITQQAIPVVPAAHYQCGGIKTDLHGATSLPGLYAIGETACTGLHGANRLASNSLLEALVMAHRAEVHASSHQHISDEIILPEWHSGEVQDPDELVVIYHNWDEIRRLMWDYMGIVRTDKRLQRAAARLKNLETEVQDFYWNFKISVDLLELRNFVTTASLMVTSAMSRKESRGLHYTLDYPQHDDAEFLRDTVLEIVQSTSCGGEL